MKVCKKLKAMKNGKQNGRENNNCRSNVRHQANVIGHTDPFVLLTVVDDVDKVLMMKCLGIFLLILMTKYLILLM